MKKNVSVDIRCMEGRTFTIGREGHIYIDSPAVSKQHAELTITKGRIYLRDLNSTNGTYLFKNKRLAYFEEGYVSPLQYVLLGDRKHLVQDLLAIISDYTVFDDTATLVSYGSPAAKTTVARKMG